MTTASAQVRMQLHPRKGASPQYRLADGTQSLLFKLDPGGPDELLVGAVTDTEGTILTPGAQLTAWLHFWAPEVCGHLRPSERIVVWYGDDVGEAWILEINETFGAK